MKKLFSNRKPGTNLPKLDCPFKDKTRGWNKATARDQAQLYLNLLDYGPGGSRSFVDTKHKKAEKPEFWPDSLSFEKYSYPAVASIKENEDLIESILDFYGYDIETHCHFSKVKEKRQRKQKQTKQVIIEGLKDKSDKEEESQNLDKEQEEQEDEEEATKSKKKDKPKNKRKKVNFLDEEDDESHKKTKPRKNSSQSNGKKSL